MSFAAEMKDFVSAFNATSQIGDRIAKRRATRTPSDSDLGGEQDPFGGAPAKVETTKTKTKSDDKSTKDGDVLAGGAGSDTLIGSAGSDSIDPNAAEKLRRRAGIASIESGGRYDALGPVTGNGDRAYGKYQIMGNNIPSWTKAATGTAMTPGQFLKSPQAQDATFDHQFDGYVQKFGLEGAAQAWLGGPGSVGKGGRKDQLGTSVSSYGQRFMQAYRGAGGQGDGSGAIADDQFQEPGDQMVGVIPDNDNQSQQPIELPQPQDSGGDGSGDGSGAPMIDIVPVDVSLGQAPQVPGFEQQLYAEDGGVIPHFATAGVVDPYNPGRGYTQMPGDYGNYANKSSTKPRQIDYNYKGKASSFDYTKPTASQLAFRAANKPVVEPAPPTAPTPQNPSMQFGSLDPLRGHVRGAFVDMAQQQVDAWNKLPPEKQTMAGYLAMRDQIQHIVGLGGFTRGQGSGGYMSPGGGGAGYTTSGRGWEEGGIIPEYADGGVVRTSETPRGKLSRKELEAETERLGGGQQGRDRAAVSANIREGRRGSSAYRPYDAVADGYFKPRKKTAPAASKTEGGAGSDTLGGGDPGGDTLAEPKTKTKVEIPPNTPRENVPAINDAETVLPEPAATERATPVPQEGYVIPGTAQERVQPSPSGAEAVAPDATPPQVVSPRVSDAAPNVTHTGVESVAPSSSAETASPVLPETVGPVQPESAFPETDYTAAFNAARIMRQRGGDPRQIGDELASKGIPTRMWPKDILQDYLNAPDQPAFAKGGVIPEETGNHNPAYTTSRSYNPPSGEPEGPAETQAEGGTEEDQQKEDLTPTPKLLTDVGNAVHQGLAFLTQHFSGDGAVPDGSGQNNAVRFARDEGAATPDEVSGVDDQIDPGRKMREGDRQMTRLAKMTTWYLGQNRPKDAAASAGSLLMYGAQRFSRIGSMAQASFQAYQSSGDPKDLQNTLDYLSQAYQMIPDGMNIELSTDGKQLLGTRTNQDGNQEQFELAPGDIPQMIRSAQDKSAYWQQIFKLADPAGAHQAAGWEHQDRVDAYKHARDRGEKASDQAAANAEWERRHKIEEADIRTRPGKETAADKKTPDWNVVNPLLAKVQAMPKPAEGDDTAAAAYNDAVSRLYDALPAGADRGKMLTDWGITPDDWKYVAPGGGAAPAASSGGGGDNLAQPAYKEGQTATGPGGKKIVFKNGQWVPVDGGGTP